MAFAYAHFTATNEQQAVDRIAAFLVHRVGWTLKQDITDVPTDRDITLESVGESDVQNPHNIFIRLRGNNNEIILTTYETYTSSSVNTGAVFDTSFGHITAVGSLIIRVIADLERVIIAVDFSGSRHFGYVGRITSYYNHFQHPYPHMIKGMDLATYDWFYSLNPRNMWMRNASGTISPYYAAPVVNLATVDSSPSVRTGDYAAFQFPIFYDDNPVYAEVPGEPRGVYWVSSHFFRHGDFVNIDDLTYVVIQGDGTYSWACGPVASGTAPPMIPSGYNVDQGV